MSTDTQEDPGPECDPTRTIPESLRLPNATPFGGVSAAKQAPRFYAAVIAATTSAATASSAA